MSDATVTATIETFSDDYEAWLDAGGPDLLLTIGDSGSDSAEPLHLLLTCDPDHYAAAIDAAERARQQGPQRPCPVGSSALPVPVSPLEYEALRDALERAAVAEELAGGVTSPLYGRVTGDVDAHGRPLGMGARERARRGAWAALELKRQLGGRLEGLASTQAWDEQARAAMREVVR